MVHEGVIELFSHRNDRASRIVSTFVVGDGNDETKTQGKNIEIRVGGIDRHAGTPVRDDERLLELVALGQ